MGAVAKTDGSTIADVEANQDSIGADNSPANEQFRLIDVIDDLSAGREVFFKLVRVARDIMNRRIMTLTLDDKVQVCHDFMRDNKIRHVPVVDPPAEEGGKPVFVGVVSDRDLSRLLSPYLGKVGENDNDRKTLKQPLGVIITRNPISVSPETAIKDVLFNMIHYHIDMIPVLTDRELVGIVTTVDILHLLTRLNRALKLFNLTGETGRPARRRMRLIDMSQQDGGSNVSSLFSSAFKTVEDVMTEQPICLEEEDTLSRAIGVMQKEAFRHLPIVSRKRRLAGLISDRNVLCHLSAPPKQWPPQAQSEESHTIQFAADPEDPNLSLPVTRVMTRKIVSVLPSCDIFNAIGILCENRISSLLVVNEDEDLLGIVTVTDVMRALFTVYEVAEKSQPRL